MHPGTAGKARGGRQGRLPWVSASCRTETTGLPAQGPVRDVWALLAATPRRCQPSTQVPREARDPRLGMKSQGGMNPRLCRVRG